MTEKEKMIKGMLYNSFGEELVNERKNARLLVHSYNMLSPNQGEEGKEIIRKLLGRVGSSFCIEQPFRCDYGYNIELGENFYSNFNLTILDCARVTIGKNCMFAPNVCLFTAGHPIDPEMRNSLFEYAFPITIGNNCWIGGNTVINPGVTIGNNVVIGSGSVVTRDIPDNVIAAGTPAKVIRPLDERDRRFYFRDKPYNSL